MGPLAGKKIVEIAGIGPGPVAGMLLADLGAEVIVVDRKSGGADVSGLPEPEFVTPNRGKRSIAIDLKADGAAAIVLDLLRDADGLVESFRPGVMERLGLGPRECLGVNPRLVYGRLTGWGQYGPLAQAAGHDLNYVALSGALWYCGRAGDAPIAPPTLVGDFAGGAMALVVGMLAGMLHAGVSGQGQVVDAAISDGAALSATLLYAMYAGGAWTPQRGGNHLDGAAHWYDCYECADGKYVSIGSLEAKFYARLLEALGLDNDPDFQGQFDRARWPDLKKRIAAVIRGRTRAEWCERLEGKDVCFAPVLDFDEAPQHPHNVARTAFIELAGVSQPAPAPRFSETVTEVQGPPPAIGQDTEAVLEELGYSAERIAELRMQGAI